MKLYSNCNGLSEREIETIGTDYEIESINAMDGSRVNGLGYKYEYCCSSRE
ncbi:hypothetical protein [Algicola sagamiensis]|uniref:hypothetical protein n=1 Tax=Algicola sagamiensis TaxID=163869 RepID=UPI00146DB9D7|nr:hypothetical protein [Algicola sagamiensis]